MTGKISEPSCPPISAARRTTKVLTTQTTPELRMRVKFGPTVAQFRGEAKLAYDHTARLCSIEGRGIDGRGASTRRTRRRSVTLVCPASSQTRAAQCR